MRHIYQYADNVQNIFHINKKNETLNLLFISVIWYVKSRKENLFAHTQLLLNPHDFLSCVCNNPI